MRINGVLLLLALTLAGVPGAWAQEAAPPPADDTEALTPAEAAYEAAQKEDLAHPPDAEAPPEIPESDLWLSKDNQAGLWSGFLFYGLSVASLQQAGKEKALRNEELAKADAAYAKYKAATNSQDANAYHQETEQHHNAAKWREARFNTFQFVGVGLFLAGTYSWFDRWLPNVTILASQDTLIYQYRF